MRMACRVAVAWLVFAAINATAHEYRQGSLIVGHPWARPTAGESKVGAAYMTLKNAGQEGDMLKAASSTVAEKAEIHEHIHDAGGVMRMRRVEGGLQIAPGASVELMPGGYHIMLIGLKQKLEEGQRIPLKLTFARAGDVEVEVRIEKSPGQPAAEKSGDEAGMQHQH
jgi:periplasmic copper chaperone A